MAAGRGAEEHRAALRRAERGAGPAGALPGARLASELGPEARPKEAVERELSVQMLHVVQQVLVVMVHLLQ